MQIPKSRLMTTTHASNRLGLKVECSDGHVPKSFLPKMVRKIEASREVWGHLLGTIDTPEEYEAYRETMRVRELGRMITNNSAECRVCHNLAHWSPEKQSATATSKHETMTQDGKTCVNCHDDVAHPIESKQDNDIWVLWRLKVRLWRSYRATDQRKVR